MIRDNKQPVSLPDALMINKGGVISLVGAGGKTTLMFRLARDLSKKGAILTTTTTKIRVPSSDESSDVIFASTAPELLDQAKMLLKKSTRVFTAAKGINDDQKLLGLKPEVIDRVWQSGIFNWIIVEADGAAQRPFKAPAHHEPVIAGSSKWVIALAGLDVVGRLLEESTVFRSKLFSKMTGIGMGEPITEGALAIVLARKNGIMKGSPLSARKIIFLNKADLAGKLNVGRKVLLSLKACRECNIDRVVIGQVKFEPAVTEYFDLQK
jgi:probable selenium-dependent hydroxylase accessory protein YqeC